MDNRAISMLPAGANARLASAIRASCGRDVSAALTFAVVIEMIDLMEAQETRLINRIQRLADRVRELEGDQ